MIFSDDIFNQDTVPFDYLLPTMLPIYWLFGSVYTFLAKIFYEIRLNFKVQ